ncbi:MAG: exodeoxyribonuclease VII small subunit [Candidatus Delongbacteria bacterium]|nr:exodeoxyribonuclease VII small subunit [Candidatus Delongbacteria bacterium]
MAKMSFEENLQELETIVGQLEKGNAGLEDSILLFEKGMKLSKECAKELDKAESRIKVLVKNEAGGYQLELLD